MPEDTLIVSSCKKRKEKLKQLIEQIEVFNAEQVISTAENEEDKDKLDTDCIIVNELNNIKNNIKNRDDSCAKKR